jgi:hypothetical protein
VNDLGIITKATPCPIAYPGDEDERSIARNLSQDQYKLTKNFADLD